MMMMMKRALPLSYFFFRLVRMMHGGLGGVRFSRISVGREGLLVFPNSAWSPEYDAFKFMTWREPTNIIWRARAYVPSSFVSHSKAL